MKRPSIGAVVFALLSSTVAAEGPDARSLKDPTAPLNAALDAGQGGASELSLSAVFLRKGQASAVVNGALVRVGDRMGNYQITAISRDEVHLLGDAPLVLTLHPRVIDNSKTEKQP